jgi:hypothetical protein
LAACDSLDGSEVTHRSDICVRFNDPLFEPIAWKPLLKPGKLALPLQRVVTDMAAEPAHARPAWARHNDAFVVWRG